MHLPENLNNPKYLRFIENMEEKDPTYFENFEVISLYETTLTNVNVLHKKCGTILTQRPQNIYSNNARCMKCHKEEAGLEKRRKAAEEFLEKFRTRYPDYANDYQILSEYDTVHTKVEVEHTCGHRYLVTPNKLLNGRRCPKCVGGVKISHDEFITNFQERYPDYYSEYVILDEYVNSNTKIQVKHNCGYEYLVTPNSLLGGTKCPRCSSIYSKESFGAKCIREFFEKRKIEIVFEKDIGCRSEINGILLYDYYIPELNLIIEYDGQQHFTGTRFKEGNTSLERRQFLDDLKTNFVLENTNFSFIRIPYTLQRDIENLLTMFLDVKIAQPTSDFVLAYLHGSSVSKNQIFDKGIVNFPIQYER